MGPAGGGCIRMGREPNWQFGGSFMAQSAGTLAGSLADLHCAAAFRRTAMARGDPAARAKAIVDREFLATGDSAEAEKENPAADDSGAEIRVAAMIDALGTGAADLSVHGPIAAQTVDVARNSPVALENSSHAFEELQAGATLAGVFDDFRASGDILYGEDAKSVNPGLADPKAKGRSARSDGRPRWR